MEDGNGIGECLAAASGRRHAYVLGEDAVGAVVVEQVGHDAGLHGEETLDALSPQTIHEPDIDPETRYFHEDEVTMLAPLQPTYA